MRFWTEGALGNGHMFLRIVLFAAINLVGSAFLAIPYLTLGN